MSPLTGVLVAVAALTSCGSEILRLRGWPNETAPFVPFRDLRRDTLALALAFVSVAALVGTWATSESDVSVVLAVALAFGSSAIAVALHNQRAHRGTQPQA